MSAGFKIESDARDTARQAGDLVAFRGMMRASRGTFSLSFGVCDHRALRDSLVTRFEAEFPGTLTVTLTAEASDVLTAVIEALPSSPPSAIFILNIETGIPSDPAAPQPLLRSLNSSREQWERFGCPVVFWLAEYAITRLTICAPDFWRYRSHQFEFVSDGITLDAAMREPFPEYAMIAALPYEEKQFRIVELERRLKEAGDPPSAVLLPHALGWNFELAALLQHATRFAEAEQCLRRALKWTENPQSVVHHMMPAALSHLALLLQATNRLAESEPLMRRALAMNEARHGPEHPDVACDLNNLATLLHDTNRLAEAEPLMRRALAIVEASHGPEHLTAAIRLNNLATLLQATNRLEEAKVLYQRALAIDEASYGPEHPEVARDLNNLATLLQATNQLAEAEPLMRRALAIDMNSYGPEHPLVSTRLNNLALLLKATNRLTEAEPLMRRALAIDEASHGPEHPNVAIGLNNLALLLGESGRMAEAVPLMRRHVLIFLRFTKSSGHLHPHLLTALKTYTELLLEWKDEDAKRTALLSLGPEAGMEQEHFRGILAQAFGE